MMCSSLQFDLSRTDRAVSWVFVSGQALPLEELNIIGFKTAGGVPVSDGAQVEIHLVMGGCHYVLWRSVQNRRGPRKDGSDWCEFASCSAEENDILLGLLLAGAANDVYPLSLHRENRRAIAALAVQGESLCAPGNWMAWQP